METMKTYLENHPEVVTALMNAASPAELEKLYTQHGLQTAEGVTYEDVFNALHAQKDGQLSEDDLDCVTGGAAGWLLAGLLLIFFKGVADGIKAAQADKAKRNS